MTKRFIVETVEITDCDTDESRIAKVITDTKETYSYEDLDEIVDVLNEQQATINEYKENWDNLVEKASEIAKRNVVLDERIGQVQRENEQLKNRLNTPI